MNYNQHQSEYKENRERRTLSNTGALIISVIATVLMVACAASLRSDGENALLGIFAPALYCAAVTLLAILLIHSRTSLFFSCGICSVVCVFVLLADAYRALLCLLCAFCAYLFYALTRKKHFTCTGYMCLCAFLYGISFIVMMAILCTEKYGDMSIDSFMRAYDAVSALFVSIPNEMIAILEQSSPEQFALLIEEYELIAQMFESMFELLIYLLPAYFLSICAICGFVTVNLAKAHTRMLGEADVFGEFSVSLVSAVIYLVLNLLALFIDPYTAVGVTIMAIVVPLELALAYSGLRFGITILKKTKKGAGYYIVPIIIAVISPNTALTILAYLGAYRSIFFELAGRVIVIRRRTDDTSIDGDTSDRDDKDDGDGEDD